ncbi:MAG: 5'/3'-nucleotidase SurE [Candidatus Marinimicrobia bacterium]|nr:5'/3'-nucleotidase SurE [Candidatus Neomarinimicrobiota bacterium]MCH7955263.1 5'/3'-nucleotidase SurE [Candidatus Neomarinimicrobiota bacterium]
MTKILLTNDDGINAPGIFALYESIKSLGEVDVIAPATEMSAVGHAITLSDPLRVEKVNKRDEFFGYAVSGTPADCVKIAVWALLDEKPDIVISGINLGNNTGISIIYSGTVSAATEGTILEIPSIAISLAAYKNPDFAFAAKFAKKLITIILEKGLPVGTLLNVNVPNVPEEEIEGVMITRQGKAVYEEFFDKRTDPWGRSYYWMAGEKVKMKQDESVDDSAIFNNMVSVTPIQFDLTDYANMELIKSWNLTK